MGLLSERIYNKSSCDKFSEKLKNYVLKNFKHAEDVMCVPTYLSICRSGLRGPLAYSLLGGGIPTQSIS